MSEYKGYLELEFKQEDFDASQVSMSYNNKKYNFFCKNKESLKFDISKDNPQKLIFHGKIENQKKIDILEIIDLFCSAVKENKIPSAKIEIKTSYAQAIYSYKKEAVL